MPRKGGQEQGLPRARLRIQCFRSFESFREWVRDVTRAERWGCRTMGWGLSFGERSGAASDGGAAQSVAQMAMEGFGTTTAGAGVLPGLCEIGCVHPKHPTL